MWNRAVSASFMEPKSTVAVAVLPLTSFTSKELMVMPRIWDDSSPAIPVLAARNLAGSRRRCRGGWSRGMPPLPSGGKLF